MFPYIGTPKAVEFVGTSSISEAVSNFITLTPPAGIQDGDLLLFFVRLSPFNLTGTTNTIIPDCTNFFSFGGEVPSDPGVTQYRYGDLFGNAGLPLQVFYRIANNESGNYEFSKTNADNWSVTCVVLRNTSSPLAPFTNIQNFDYETGIIRNASIISNFWTAQTFAAPNIPANFGTIPEQKGSYSLVVIVSNNSTVATYGDLTGFTRIVTPTVATDETKLVIYGKQVTSTGYLTRPVAPENFLTGQASAVRYSSFCFNIR